jgi:hypothetical protein
MEDEEYGVNVIPPINFTATPFFLADEFLEGFSAQHAVDFAKALEDSGLNENQNRPEEKRKKLTKYSKHQEFDDFLLLNVLHSASTMVAMVAELETKFLPVQILFLLTLRMLSIE